MDEEALKAKLQRIEALFAGAATPGERDAAGAARERILRRLEEVRQQDPPVEWHLPQNDLWEVRLLVALLRRYQLSPYRRWRQRYTTVMVKAPRKFMDEILWPEYTELSSTLRDYLAQVTDRVIASAINSDLSEAPEIREPRQITGSPST